MKHYLKTLSLLVSMAPTACTGSPATVALQPDFDVTTAGGPASVSIRETPPDMTFAEFAKAVKAGMQPAMPEAVQPTCSATPFPDRRIVWHVYPIFPRGTSRLVVNVFDGSVPFEHAQQVIDNSAPPSTIVYAVRTLTIASLLSSTNTMCRPLASATWRASTGVSSCIPNSR